MPRNVYKTMYFLKKSRQISRDCSISEYQLTSGTFNLRDFLITGNIFSDSWNVRLEIQHLQRGYFYKDVINNRELLKHIIHSGTYNCCFRNKSLSSWYLDPIRSMDLLQLPKGYQHANKFCRPQTFPSQWHSPPLSLQVSLEQIQLKLDFLLPFIALSLAHFIGFMFSENLNYEWLELRRD